MSLDGIKIKKPKFIPGGSEFRSKPFTLGRVENLFQLLLFIVALVSLCYQIFRGKK